MTAYGSPRWLRLFVTAILAASTICCSSGDDAAPDVSAAGRGGVGGASGTAGGGTAGGGTAGGGTAGGGTAGGGTAGGGTAGNTFDEVGVCGHRGEATVSSSEFSGFEEYFLIGEEGFGTDVCVVRFEVERSGDAPAGCTDCEWSHRVTLSDPRVVVDANGVCGRSELGFDAEVIAELDGSQAAYGYVSEFAGHVSVLMKYDEEKSVWDAFGNATFDEQAAAFHFERRNGFCNY